MMPAVNAVVLAASLFWSGAGARPAAINGDTSALQFYGFRAGAPLEEVRARLAMLDASRLRCKHSRLDSSVTECRAALTDGELGRVDLWVSAIDSLAGVMTLSGPVDPERLGYWREALLQRYGRVSPHVQGTQSMLQWVRRGRMLRLTWRVEAGKPVASVSLVDGHVLDDWGRARSQQGGRDLSNQSQSRTR
jgi:hypothetical protein